MAVMATPSLRFPLPAGGTERARGLVPLAKRGEPKGGGALMNSGWRLVLDMIEHASEGSVQGVQHGGGDGAVRVVAHERATHKLLARLAVLP